LFELVKLVKHCGLQPTDLTVKTSTHATQILIKVAENRQASIKLFDNVLSFRQSLSAAAFLL